MEHSTGLFKNAVIRRMLESMERVEKCIGMLNKEQVWHRINSKTPSVGNLVLHLSGNIEQWVICTFSTVPDLRDRDREFSTQGPLDPNGILSDLNNTVHQAVSLIEQLNSKDLDQGYNVQGFEENGTDILVHVVEHLSYHTGQIALHTKILTNKDLGFYTGQDLNGTQPTES